MSTSSSQVDLITKSRQIEDSVSMETSTPLCDPLCRRTRRACRQDQGSRRREGMNRDEGGHRTKTRRRTRTGTEAKVSAGLTRKQLQEEQEGSQSLRVSDASATTWTWNWVHVEAGGVVFEDNAARRIGKWCEQCKALVKERYETSTAVDPSELRLWCSSDSVFEKPRRGRSQQWCA